MYMYCRVTGGGQKDYKYSMNTANICKCSKLITRYLEFAVWHRGCPKMASKASVSFAKSFFCFFGEMGGI